MQRSPPTAGTVHDAITRKDVPLNSPVSGAIPLGVVTHTWIDHKTGALHWAGTVDVEQDSILYDTIRQGKYAACSLQYHRASPPQYPHAHPIELSVCHNPRWRDTRLYWDGALSDYMRKTNYLAYRNTMADQAPAPPQPRDAAGRYTSQVQSSDPAQAADIVMSAADKEEAALAAAIEAAPDVLRNALQRTQESRAEIARERDAARKRADENEALAAAAKNKIRDERLAAMQIMQDLWKQNPDILGTAPNITPDSLLVAAAAGSPETAMLWDAIRTTTAAVTAQKRPAQQPLQQQQEYRHGSRPGDIVPEAQAAKRHAAAALASSTRATYAPPLNKPNSTTSILHESAQDLIVKASNDSSTLTPLELARRALADLCDHSLDTSDKNIGSRLHRAADFDTYRTVAPPHPGVDDSVKFYGSAPTKAITS